MYEFAEEIAEDNDSEPAPHIPSEILLLDNFGPMQLESIYVVKTAKPPTKVVHKTMQVTA